MALPLGKRAIDTRISEPVKESEPTQRGIVEKTSRKDAEPPSEEDEREEAASARFPSRLGDFG